MLIFADCLIASTQCGGVVVGDNVNCPRIVLWQAKAEGRERTGRQTDFV